MADSLPEELSEKFERTIFTFRSENEDIRIAIATTKALDAENQQGEEDTDKNVAQSIDQILSEWESLNVQNIITKGEQYITPNNVTGIKTFGTGDFPIADSEDGLKGEYAIFSFASTDAIMHVILIWSKDDVYIEDIIERVIGSIELKTDEQANLEQEAQN